MKILATAGAFVALSNAGCTALAVMMTDSEQLSATPVAVRATTHQADVNGQQCYVEKNMETIKRAHVPLAFRWGVLVEGLGGGATALVPSSDCKHCLVILVPLLADAVLTAAYIFIRDDAVYTSDSWQESNETASCAK